MVRTKFEIWTHSHMLLKAYVFAGSIQNGRGNRHWIVCRMAPTVGNNSLDRSHPSCRYAWNTRVSAWISIFHPARFKVATISAARVTNLVWGQSFSCFLCIWSPATSRIVVGWGQDRGQTLLRQNDSWGRTNLGTITSRRALWPYINGAKLSVHS